jgi:hypothetical protein
MKHINWKELLSDLLAFVVITAVMLVLLWLLTTPSI